MEQPPHVHYVPQVFTLKLMIQPVIKYVLLKPLPKTQQELASIASSDVQLA